MEYLGLDKEKVKTVTAKLNQLLANYHIYYQNLRNFHWNVQGVHFFDLHNKFEEMYDDAKVKIDDIAERILSLHQHPVSTLREYLEMSQIKEHAPGTDAKDMVESLLNDHRILIGNFREVMNIAGDIGDESTIDLIGGYLGEMEKTSWMLSAWLVQKGYSSQNRNAEHTSVKH